jgi:hypothetical protein
LARLLLKRRVLSLQALVALLRVECGIVDGSARLLRLLQHLLHALIVLYQRRQLLLSTLLALHHLGPLERASADKLALRIKLRFQQSPLRL